MIDPEDAIKMILKAAKPLKIQPISLALADGYCLAQTVRADRDQPPTDRSAMDGYAVCAAQVEACSGTLQLAGEVAAGNESNSRIRPGTCVRIFTGAVLPPGADAVVKVEDTHEERGRVAIRGLVGVGGHVRKRGEETARGDTVLAKGTMLGPVQIGLCAFMGKAVVKVYGRPQLAVISTGSEIVPAEQAVKPWQIRDANGPALCAALKGAGCSKPFYRIVQDKAPALRRSLMNALKKCDIVLLTGGVSVGRYDLVPEVIQSTGARIRFHKVAIKPGKPVLYATLGKNQHIFGLPGNPLSALNGFHEFVLPAIRRLAGQAAQDCRCSVYLPLAETLTPRGSRVEHLLVKVVHNEAGSQLVPISSKGSADLASANQADGVAILPRDKRQCQVGRYVEFRPWK